jgi:hypothetical protein
MIIVSLLTKAQEHKYDLPSINKVYKKMNYSAKPVWISWGILAVLMIGIYLFFQWAGTAM